MNLDNLETRSNAPSRKIYTGIASLKIVLVNPTRAQIAKLYQVDEAKVKEPKYFTDDSTRIDFWYENHETLTTPLLGKFSLFVSNTVRNSQAGKTQYIDTHSKTCWADSLGDLSERNLKLSDYSKLKLDKVREALRGEEDLYNLLRAYGNIDTNSSPLMLDNFLAIIKGQVDELTDFFSYFNKRGGGVKVLLGVKDGQYQDVWNSMFLPVNGKLTDYLRNKISDTQYGYKHHYTIGLTEFVASEEPEKVDSGTDPWTTEDADPFSDAPASAQEGSAPEVSPFDDDLFG